MTDSTATIISDPLRQHIVAHRQDDGSVIVRAPRILLALSPSELDRLVVVARPDKARIQRFPMAPGSPQSDE